MTPSPALSTADPLPSPVRRNCPWWPLQIVAQGLAALWFNYRARGVEHLPKETGALLLINHRSFMDPVFVGMALNRPVSFVARHNLFEIPGFGTFIRRIYAIPINRDAAGSASVREIVRRLKHGFLVGLFPEGTRQTGSEPLGRLKPGFVSILRRAEVPVIPVGIAGASDVMPRGTFLIRPRLVRVVFGAPIPPDQIAELSSRERERELLELVAARMTAAVVAAQDWRHQAGDGRRSLHRGNVGNPPVTAAGQPRGPF